MNAVNEELSDLELKDPVEISNYAYRIAEKAVLIYSLQHGREIFDAAYKASSKKLPASNKNVIYPGAWEKFRKKHFGKLRPEQYQYVRPYLEAIDWIVSNKIRPNSKRT